jgi:thiaminase/transcriptional activator TenA
VVGEICREFAGRVDSLAARAGEDERARMGENFLVSCRMEYLFWEMAYNLEGWPV